MEPSASRLSFVSVFSLLLLLSFLGFVEHLLHLLLLLRLLQLVICPDLPTLDVRVPARQLEFIDFGDNLGHLFENGHHHELNEARLAASNLSSLAVAEHGNFEAL
uniref:Uncharacterized protein n=1 Tax=Strombidium inclinatum TaxID=197538 RepID=A0A7S3IJY9_9SPIT